MESQPQNPEFRNNHENFHPRSHSFTPTMEFKFMIYKCMI